MRNITDPLLALPRPIKRAIAVGVDAALCALTLWIAYYLRLGQWVPMNGRPAIAIVLSIVIAIPVFAAFGLYRMVFRHAGVDAMTSCAMACIIYGLLYSSFITAYGFDGVPRTVGLIQPALLYLAIAVTRISTSAILGNRYRRIRASAARNRVLIYGAGSAGQQLARVMENSHEMKVVGFVDDDRSLHHSRVRGLRIYPPQQLGHYIESLGITDILLAIPSANRTRRTQIIADLKDLGVTVRTLPGLMDLAHGAVHASDLHEVTITDLLQRDPVPYESNALLEHVADNVILVTGAGGSIGSELCRQIIAMRPKRLLLVDVSEYALYQIHLELQSTGGERLVPLLASVTDTTRMETILRTWKPQMIFHAAAYKHVPLVEHNPLQGLSNNVIGTATVAQLAARYNVRDFVLISTDKAVRPTNIMGASKRLAELVLQGLSSLDDHDTCYSIVRFGNVLGSSGSVVPLFTRQIQAGGPITITHPDITRYFMTIPEAVHLVLQAGAMATGGEVFVLDMGEPVRVIDMARNMIRLSGLTVRDEGRPDGDIEIRVVGLRPGEKLYEELLIGANPLPTAHPRIMKANEHKLPWSELDPQLLRLAELIGAGNVKMARELLCQLVVEFAPSSDIVDWVSLENGRPGKVLPLTLKPTAARV
ncbi:polysaccharide biosynthesis protein [Sphingomonas sp. RIT328]|uniref:polysaccharide biosynthesis protein n=1 Tax=Sphingomonas sp. RIT328 TaxID=1470591 RepID=UPI00044CAD37|nr:nucleoside-diphosphate sugar epimerase/dehydratase [Sphingomonas sp. RIT328]EZP55124.1 Polysaccharide biosynthesis protein CapD precursor [Sphingomonas sp. RIT328]